MNMLQEIFSTVGSSLRLLTRDSALILIQANERPRDFSMFLTSQSFRSSAVAPQSAYGLSSASSILLSSSSSFTQVLLDAIMIARFASCSAWISALISFCRSHPARRRSSCKQGALHKLGIEEGNVYLEFVLDACQLKCRVFLPHLSANSVMTLKSSWLKNCRFKTLLSPYFR